MEALLPTSLRARLGARVPQRLPATPTTPYAAVAAVIRYVRDEPEVLLIKRSERPGDPWSGQMAFPGGRQSPGDADLVATAVRETHEEVGVDLSESAELVGRLDDVQAISRAQPTDLIIVPHVFLGDAAVPLAPAAGEVEEALWASLTPMFRGETSTTYPFERDGIIHELPGYRVGPHVVWGLTYRMLELLFSALR